MIDRTVFFKISFVAARCNYGLVCDLNTCHGSAFRCERLLKTDAERTAAVSITHSCHIPAKIDQRMPDSFLFQIILQTVRDITFCDASEINPCVGIRQSDSVFVHLYLSVIDMGDSLLKSSRIGKRPCLVILEVPQGADRRDRDIEQAA